MQKQISLPNRIQLKNRNRKFMKLIMKMMMSNKDNLNLWLVRLNLDQHNHNRMELIALKVILKRIN